VVLAAGWLVGFFRIQLPAAARSTRNKVVHEAHKEPRVREAARC
jgi:hypothetical protein